MKKTIALICTFLVVFMNSQIMGVWAKEEIKVTVNGNTVQFDQPPIIEDGRTLVPVRAIFEALGCDIIWDGENLTIDAFQNGTKIMTLWIGRNRMWTKSDDVKLDVPPQIVNNRTLVPVRVISESMGATVRWDENMRTVSISHLVDTILGKWIFDVAENSDPDMAGVSIDIEKGVMHLKNSMVGMSMDAKYEKNNEIIYITELSMNGQTISGEFLELPYKLLNSKLMLDMTELGLGKVIMCRP